MTQTSTSQGGRDIDEEIIRLIHSKMSSIDFMSEHLNLEKEAVLERIARLLEDGVIQGRISSDNSRFFRSDVKKATKSDGSVEETAAIDEIISKLPVNEVTGPKCNKGHIGRKFSTR